MGTAPTLRDRKKAATRQRLLDFAHARFHQVGFDNVTLEEICEGCEVSKRTFFRYFPSKEALVFPKRAQHLADFKAVLAAAPRDENPFDTLRRATRASSAEYTANAAQILAQQVLIKHSSVLQATEQAIDRDWEAAMATFLAEKGGDQAEPLRVRVLAGAMIGVIRATMRYWYEVEGKEDLCQLGLDALDCLQRGFPLSSD